MLKLVVKKRLITKKIIAPQVTKGPPPYYKNMLYILVPGKLMLSRSSQLENYVMLVSEYKYSKVKMFSSQT